ncbi:MAG: DUF3520 domain-containing protein, partial [Hyphomicrobiales bacterium]|nr:DUF3520 domain-containing protein [Hyphomicrobiales bacterium]
KLRYKAPDGDTSRKIELPITREVEKASLDALGNDMRFAAAVAAFGQKLRGNLDMQDYGYAKVEELAVAAKGADRFGLRAEFVDLVRLARLLSPTDESHVISADQ